MASSEQSGPSGGSEFLSQADIDRLMAEAAAVAERKPPVFRASGERFADTDQPRVEVHDFSNPMVVDDLIMRALRQRHQEFASFVSARLSIFLRMDFSLKLQRLATLVYHRFTASVPNPGHVVLFKMEPLAGVGVLDMNTRLGLTVVDRMLGGKGHSVKVPDNLTEIEVNLLDDILLVVIEEWCRLWSIDRRLTPAIVGRENGGRYLQTSASDTVMLVAVLEGAIGDCIERIQLAIPLPSVEGVIRGMGANHQGSAERDRALPRTAWRPSYNGIPIPISVEWDACELPVREVLALKPGAVLRLPPQIIQDSKVRVAGATKFVGEVGIEEDRLAVRIDQKLSPEDV